MQVFNAAIFRRGQKKELFDDKQQDADWDEAVELRDKLGDLHALWTMPRAGAHLSAAIWRPLKGVAELVVQRGKLFNHIGYTQGSKHFLHIEEAVYMVDRTNLLLFVEPSAPGQQQRLLSLQEAYDLMVGCGFSTDKYLVYAKLMRAGYIVQRHPARWTLKISEEPRQVWYRWYTQPQGQPAGAAAAGGAAAAAAAAAGGPAPQQPAPQQQQQQPAAPAAKAPPSRSGGPGSGSGSSGKKRKAEQVAQGRWWHEGPTSLPWLPGLPADFLDSLPRVEVAPDTRSKYGDEYPAMAPLASMTESQVLQAQVDEAAVGADSNPLDFDVYEPNSKFSRRAAGSPSFRIVVTPTSPASSHPTTRHLFLGLGDMAAAERASPGIPVKFATVEEGDIAFYGFTASQLHPILQ